MEEASLWLWDCPPSDWVGDHWGHQGSKGPLCLHHMGYRDPPDSTNKGSQSLACHLPQGDWGWLCSYLSRGGELLPNSHQGGRVQWHFQSLPNPTIPHQRHPVSGGRVHWGGRKGLPHLPHCLQYCPQGQPSQGPWHNGYPLPPTTRKCFYIYPAQYSPGGIPSRMGSCPTDSSFLCPSSTHSSSTTHLTRWGPLPHLGLLLKSLLRGHPIPSGRRKCPSTRPCPGVTRKPSAGTPD